MLISRYVTIFLIPIGLMMSSCNLLPLSVGESICGAIFGYFFLFSINSIFKYVRKIDGIGEGDYDLLALIGSFTGILGCWISITLGSMLGSLYGITMLMLSSNTQTRQQDIHTTKIPFGPFLAIGALLFTFMQRYIFYYLLSA